jgi:hypothetical protein
MVFYRMLCNKVNKISTFPKPFSKLPRPLNKTQYKEISETDMKSDKLHIGTKIFCTLMGLCFVGMFCECKISISIK